MKRAPQRDQARRKKASTQRAPAGIGPGVRLRLEATLHRPAGSRPNADDWLFLVLPKGTSATLPSRGMVSVEGTLNGAALRATLLPDGDGGHWLKVDKELQVLSGARAGDVVSLEISPVAPGDEPEPPVPPDLAGALAAASERVREAWSDITPAARRDFVHWITSPKKPETRLKRIETACDMLAKGKRRPCCFDRSGMYSKSLNCPTPDLGTKGARDKNR